MSYKVLLSSFLSVVLFFSITIACADEIKLYRNFPVYPPEEIENLLKTNPGHFRLYYAENPGPFFGYPGDDIERWKLHKEKGEKFSQEFAKAKDYIVTNAKRLGWNIIEEGGFKDGGSCYWKFIKEDPKLSVVVTLWGGMGGGRENSEIEYSFNE